MSQSSFSNQHSLHHDPLSRTVQGNGPGSASPPQPRHGALAAVLFTMAVGGLGGAYAVFIPVAPFPHAAQAPDPVLEMAEALRDSQSDVLRLTGELRDMRMTLGALRDDLDRQTGDLAGRQDHVITRIEQADRLVQENAITLARVADEVAQVERRIPPGPASQPGPSASEPGLVTGSLGQLGGLQKEPRREPRKEARQEPLLEGWVLREVHDDGLAVVESASGLYGLRAGDTLPGVGPVEKVERRAKGWVLVTAQGVIDPSR